MFCQECRGGRSTYTLYTMPANELLYHMSGGQSFQGQVRAKRDTSLLPFLHVHPGLYLSSKEWISAQSRAWMTDYSKHSIPSIGAFQYDVIDAIGLFASFHPRRPPFTVESYHMVGVVGG
jgi:hypothetical protein